MARGANQGSLREGETLSTEVTCHENSDWGRVNYLSPTLCMRWAILRYNRRIANSSRGLNGVNRRRTFKHSAAGAHAPACRGQTEQQSVFPAHPPPSPFRIFCPLSDNHLFCCRFDFLSDAFQ